MNRVERAKATKWYRRPAFIIPLIIVFAIFMSGGGLLIWSVFFAEEEAESAGISTTVGGSPEEEEAPAEVPLATASETIVASMTLEEKIGQMMMVGFQSPAPDAEITDAIQKRHVGGVILYDRNISDQGQVAGMNSALQKLAADAKAPAKLMIAVDQEGGKTRRFEDIGPYYSQPMIGEMNDAAPAAAQQQSSSAARDLKKLGINTNLAPVVDVSSGWGSIMDGRSYSSDPQWVAELSAAAVKGYNNATTICSPKHFPGHGSSDADSEETLPTVEGDLETIQNNELPPFAAVIREGAPMIMVGHLSVPALDPTGSPASLSKMMITDLLRGSLGFDGVVITDDMEMGAILENYSVADAAVASVAAGADIVMVAQTSEKQIEAYDAMIAAVKSGKLKEADIDKSVIRILDMKKKYRLEK